MNFLPNEMLFEIFKHLRPPDLLALTEVNRNFHKIITTSELVHKLTLNFRKLNENGSENGLRRKYRQLRIGFFKPTVHTAILSESGSNFVRLDFAFCKLKLDVYRRILWACPNVKVLKFLKAQLSDVPNDVKWNLPVLVGVKMSFHCSDPRIFRLLSSCIVRQLDMDQKYLKATGNLDDFVRFLAAQEMLEELTLSDFFRTNLFYDNYLDHVQFRLRTLRLKNICLARTIDFKNFVINNHLETLEQLEVQKLENCNISSIIDGARFLKELKIDNLVAISDLEEVPHLQKLTLFGQLPLKLNQLIHKFPSLLEVEMHYCQLWYDEEEFMKAYGRLGAPHDFTVMNVIDTTISRLRTKTIKNLMLKNVKICQDFFESNKQVEVLHIENCAFSEDLMKKFLTEKLVQLTIVNEVVTQRLVDQIEVKCTNLRILRLKINKKSQVDLKKLHEMIKLRIFLEFKEDF